MRTKSREERWRRRKRREEGGERAEEEEGGERERLTAAGDADGLREPLVGGGRQAELQQQHGPLGGAHHQAGARPALRCLAGETLAEVEGGDGLARLPLDARHAGAARAAEGVVPGVCSEKTKKKTKKTKTKTKKKRERAEGGGGGG